MRITADYSQCGHAEQDLKRIAEPAIQYLARIQSGLLPGTYDSPESFLLLPGDKVLHEEVIRIAERHAESSGIVLFGVGGSSLGAHALIQALGSDVPVWYAETFDPFLIEKIREKIVKASSQDKHLAYIVASKSGTTLETLVNFSALFEDIKKNDAEWKQHTVFISQSTSPLVQYAKKEAIDWISVPESVPGRFSVFSAMGLLPAAVAGIDIQELCRGATDAKETFLSDTISQNYALSGSAASYAHLQTGKGVHVFLTSGPYLSEIGLWWQQLLAESLGKNGMGITPLPLVSSRDLHTVGQYLMDGPDTVFTNFLRVRSLQHVTTLPHELLDASVHNKDIDDLSDAVLQGVQTTLTSKNKPFITYTSADITPASVGEFMMGMMVQTILIAKLMDVDAFNQPAVELYKEEMKKLL